MGTARLRPRPWTGSASILLFMSVYLIYFVVTYVGFQRGVLTKN